LKIKQAMHKAKGSPKHKVVDFTLNGESQMKLQTSKNLDPGFKRVAQYLLNTDVRKHNKYCPCCREYQEGSHELTSAQMQEFLEYIR
jgi:hypothetical protein